MERDFMGAKINRFRMYGGNNGNKISIMYEGERRGVGSVVNSLEFSKGEARHFPYPRSRGKRGRGLSL